LAFPAKRNVVTVLPVPGATGAVTSAVPVASGHPSTNLPPSPDARLIAPRMLSLYQGQFLLRLDDVPYTGSLDATNVVVYLFDYTCPHCRDLHGILKTAQTQLSNQLGVVALPMPMSTNCNPLIPADFQVSSNACGYARLGLGLWRLQPSAYWQFDDWFFATNKPPSLAEARDFASQLVEPSKLEAAMGDPWVAQQILVDCQLHYNNWQATGQPAMPQLILGPAVSVGPLNSVQHLVALLGRYLGIEVSPNQR
jgi:hypothetical protein